MHSATTNRGKSSKKAKVSHVAAGEPVTLQQRSGVIVLPRPPAPGEVVATVRKELERLGQRWKNLLPQLKQTNGSNGRSTTRKPPRRRRG